jgi:prolyl-tRNA synthetase
LQLLRDLGKNVAEVARRDTKEKMSVDINGLPYYIKDLLDEIQLNIYNRSKQNLEAHIMSVDTWNEFVEILDGKSGFVSAHWDGTAETEEKIKELTKATIRCIPLNNKQENEKCILTGNPSTQRVLFARAY